MRFPSKLDITITSGATSAQILEAVVVLPYFFFKIKGLIGLSPLTTDFKTMWK